MNKKINGIEPQLASSILYYDEEELKRFLLLFDQLSQDSNVVIDGIFITFVKYIRNFKKFDNDPEKRRNNLILHIRSLNEQNVDSKKKDDFDFWFDHVLSLDPSLEFAEEIIDHFLWENYKKSIERLDKSDIPFSEKLLIRPHIFTSSNSDEIISLDSIEIEEESNDNFTTSIEELDRLVQFKNTNFIVIASRPGVGKSLFMLQIAGANARVGKKVLYLSFEMNKNQINERIINQVTARNVRSEFLDDYGNLNFNGLKEEFSRIKSSRLFKPINQNLNLYVTTASSADAILDKIEKVVKENHYDIIFIDYLQLLRYINLDEWASLRRLTNALKNLAFRLNIVIVTGSQVSRSSTEHGLYLADLFGSSSIEADTDIVIGLENPRERRQGERAAINIKVMKNREGDLGEIKAIADYSIGKIFLS